MTLSLPGSDLLAFAGTPCLSGFSDFGWRASPVARASARDQTGGPHFQRTSRWSVHVKWASSRPLLATRLPLEQSNANCFLLIEGEQPQAAADPASAQSPVRRSHHGMDLVEQRKLSATIPCISSMCLEPYKTPRDLVLLRAPQLVQLVGPSIPHPCPRAFRPARPERCVCRSKPLLNLPGSAWPAAFAGNCCVCLALSGECRAPQPPLPTRPVARPCQLSCPNCLVALGSSAASHQTGPT